MGHITPQTSPAPASGLFAPCAVLMWPRMASQPMNEDNSLILQSVRPVPNALASLLDATATAHVWCGRKRKIDCLGLRSGPKKICLKFHRAPS
jgi:hypothetical protein